MGRNVRNLKKLKFSRESEYAQLPRGPSFSSSSNKNQPIFGERNLQEQKLLNVGKVLNETSVGEEQ